MKHHFRPFASSRHSRLLVGGLHGMSTLLADVTSPELETMAVRPWPDPVIDALGHDPRSPYVERFWLPVLGPSTTWLLRLLAAELEVNPAGFELDLAEAAHVLGLGNR